MLRKTIFWIHLVSGLISGIVIAIMSLTGIAIAFEEEILAWVDRDLSHVERPAPNAQPLSVSALKEAIDREMPEFGADYLNVMSDPNSAYEFFAGRQGPVYINPYTAELQHTKTESIHHFLHEIEEWHRWLAINPDDSYVGRFITGVSNLAFLLLCLTGLYLWFPKIWKWRFFRPILWFKSNKKSKARDFNWHNVFGFWNMPILVILAGTGVVISFGWAHNLVFTLSGEEASEFRDFRMTFVPPVEVPTPPPEAQKVSIETLLKKSQEAYPEYKTIGLNLGEPRNDDGPINVALTLPDYMPNRAYVPLELDPYTGEVLRGIRLQDRSIGLQARIWIRFLHTGGAFGVTGKVIASIATAASLVLVYTGFALSWRRFFPKKNRKN